MDTDNPITPDESNDTEATPEMGGETSEEVESEDEESSDDSEEVDDLGGVDL